MATFAQTEKVFDYMVPPMTLPDGHNLEKLHLMHASSKEEKVVITDNTLPEYLTGRKSVTGIMLSHPL